MKKKTKIILFSIVGVLVLAGAVFSMVLVTNDNTGYVSGGLVDIIEDQLNGGDELVEGTGECDWKKYDVDIVSPAENVGTKGVDFCSNNDNDSIYNLTFDNHRAVYYTNNKNKVKYYYTYLSFDVSFSVFDYLHVAFVLEKPDGTRYTIHETYSDTLYDKKLEYNPDRQAELGVDFTDTKIVEIWVRTFKD